ncbi:MAG: glycoside hydrolase [Anaerolineae bacterium]|jgi:1,4-alpha-glucan branching enzyme|nr:glycoside hydrolase [Anaerolineae bacterium]MBT7070225.1 glycoside hydrolase [Anaerolineae bacterium]MBT7324956.1 glycoside hydrolase [Anaerolineae bacterium]
MLTKRISKDGKKCRVTFQLPADIEAKTVTLCGDFNAWDKSALPMKQRKDGSFSTGLTLETSKEYRFRYWLDDERWENDWEADAYKPNEFGSEDSILSL